MARARLVSRRLPSYTVATAVPFQGEHWRVSAVRRAFPVFGDRWAPKWVRGVLEPLCWKKEVGVVLGVAALTVGAYRLHEYVEDRRLGDKRRCPDCHGRGSVKCFQCGGAKILHVKGERVPHACRRCSARGVLKCTRCNGAGLVPRADDSGSDAWKIPDSFRQGTAAAVVERLQRHLGVSGCDGRVQIDDPPGRQRQRRQRTAGSARAVGP
ncbi:hypothetical protein CDCA_CDCA10G2998 [Cyanidium caldarium]|uniref:Uncharacterized protein n=1 Tax=Cyanidium caldarium TaxID=2771 RepID=A0AAV9IYU3_CYACA|nr:hypothetical protein CDCA_CDCA10G2998 [Cyanidium caldarium]